MSPVSHSLDPSALVWTGVIFVTYLAALRLRQIFPRSVWASPIITTSAVVALVALIAAAPLDTLDAGGSVWMALLVPATMAMAIPLYDHRHLLQQHARAIMPALIIGSVSAVASALGVALLLGATQPSLLALAPKSVTTPIAVGIGLETNAPIGLVACLVIVTGLIGIILGPVLFRRLKWHNDDAAQGLAYGLAAHAIGTAEAWQKSSRMGSFAALALGVNGLLTGLILPTILAWLFP